jgi:hypothetical protein
MQLLELRADVRGAQRGEELLRQQPARRGHVRRLQEGTRRVQLVRKEGRDVSSQFGRRDETCPVSTGGRKGGGSARAGPVAPRPPAAAFPPGCCAQRASCPPSRSLRRRRRRPAVTARPPAPGRTGAEQRRGAGAAPKGSYAQREPRTKGAARGPSCGAPRVLRHPRALWRAPRRYGPASGALRAPWSHHRDALCAQLLARGLAPRVVVRVEHRALQRGAHRLRQHLPVTLP